jgi:CBS domain containing-hemolysin-like protein
VPEEMLLNELLDQMRRSGQTMVIVVDNFGGTAGLVTIQDVVAEIIGETHEPESPEEPNIRILDEQTFLIQAQTDLEEVNEFLNLMLPLSEEYQTLGGFMIYELQKIPTIGEQLLYNNCQITVESAEGPRLERIQVRRLEAPEVASSLESQSGQQDVPWPDHPEPVDVWTESTPPDADVSSDHPASINQSRSQDV